MYDTCINIYIYIYICFLTHLRALQSTLSPPRPNWCALDSLETTPEMTNHSQNGRPRERAPQDSPCGLKSRNALEIEEPCGSMTNP